MNVLNRYRVGRLVLTISLCAAGSVYAAPKLECGNPNYDFGAQITGTSITNQFVLWNRGDDPLEILEIKDCCGMTSTIEPMTVSPGTNAVCTSVFNTKNREGAQMKQIVLVTNDKRFAYYTLRMSGTLNKQIGFTPRYVRLKDVLPDGDFSETITATNLLSEGVTLESVNVTISGLSAEIISSDDRSWVVQLKSNGSLVSGKSSGMLEMNFSTGTVDVPVAGVVDPIVRASLNQISFSSDSGAEIKRTFTVSSVDGRPFDVLSARLKGARGKIEFKQLSNGEWRLNLTVSPDSITSSASVVVVTSLESDAPLAVPLVKAE